MSGIRAAVAAALILSAGCGSETPAAPKERETLFLATSLPLLFGDGFSLDATRPEVVTALEQDYALTAIDLPSQVPPGATLLAIQPRALPAEELVALDNWVRDGGRIVLLADPMLEWPSERPLGDRLRPPTMFADTGLLARWGLRLDAPDARGLVYSASDTDPIAMLSPGVLVASGKGCAVEEGGWMALCTIGKGQAVVVADAEFVNVEAVRAAGGDPRDNLRTLTRMIARN